MMYAKNLWAGIAHRPRAARFWRAGVPIFGRESGKQTLRSSPIGQENTVRYSKTGAPVFRLEPDIRNPCAPKTRGTGAAGDIKVRFFETHFDGLTDERILFMMKKDKSKRFRAILRTHFDMLIEEDMLQRIKTQKQV